MAESVTLTDFRNQFSEFSTRSDAEVNRVLEEACHIHSARKLATLFCAAHLLVLNSNIAEGEKTSGEIESAGTGPLRVSYKTQAENGRDVFFTSTNYGRRFLTLEKRNPRTGIGAMVVG